MSLSARLAERECRHIECTETRVDGALLCARHLSDDYMHRLVKLPDGTFGDRRRFVPRELTWRAAA
jgi:hypothetical protein